jgi:hypothetical protein
MSSTGRGERDAAAMMAVMGSPRARRRPSRRGDRGPARETTGVEARALSAGAAVTDGAKVRAAQAVPQAVVWACKRT